MKNGEHGDNRENARREAEAELHRLRRDDAELGGSLAAIARRTAVHFAGGERHDDDRIEVWGKRIGRTLSAVAFVGLAFYLYVTFVK